MTVMMEADTTTSRADQRETGWTACTNHPLESKCACLDSMRKEQPQRVVKKGSELRKSLHLRLASPVPHTHTDQGHNRTRLERLE